MQHSTSASELRFGLVSSDQSRKPVALKTGNKAGSSSNNVSSASFSLALPASSGAPPQTQAIPTVYGTNGHDLHDAAASASVGMRHTVTGAVVRTVERLVVVQRSAVGFGFVLRGPQGLPQAPGVTHLPFTPSPTQPSLEHLERVEPDSPASRAGLHAGDFLLEVNGEPVHNATHEHTVELIRRANAGGALYLKVVSADAYASVRGVSPLKDSAPTQPPSASAPYMSATPSTPFSSNGRAQHSYTVGPLGGQVLASRNQVMGRARTARRTLTSCVLCLFSRVHTCFSINYRIPFKPTCERLLLLNFERINRTALLII